MALLNGAHAICIRESWLSTDMDDCHVSIPGYNLFRRDRLNNSGRGGVCLYLKSSYPCKRLTECDNPDIESLCVSTRPASLQRCVSSIIICVVYHSATNRQAENTALCDHIQSNLDTLLAKQPNALVIVTGISALQLLELTLKI